MSSSSTKSTIKDTIIVAHSMGNLMLAGAIANGLCELDSSSTWVAMPGPMKGSMASDFIQKTCAGNASKILKDIGDIVGKCPPKKSITSLAYEGESYSSKKLDAAYKAAHKVYRDKVYAVMCGKSDKNDGVVEFQSCAGGFPDDKFGDTYRDRFYRAELNHFDMEFLAGDSPLRNDAKMPVKWFECLM
ncbi:unnamed protein product [Peronospora destructor]|uniref:Alpha/beta hydrolase n=1 Tax=Peronospora destructor TaxID=86335 RepID=A0AAV0V9L7_9STRA|nr:unnamed protein product [Peronospora destructor]